MKNLNRVLVPFLAVLPLSASAAVEISAFELGNTAKIKVNGLLQAWSMGHEVANAKDQTFRLRRAEIKLSGNVLSQSKFFFMVDPAKLIPPPGGKSIGADQMLQDFGVGYEMVKGLELTVGQFKTPTSAEGLDSSGDLPLPERSLTGKNFGDRRELGVRVAYKNPQWNAASMLTTGQPVTAKGHYGLNDLDTRVEITPLKNLGLGTFATLGHFNYISKGRWGANARYKIEKTDLRVEYGIGRTNGVHNEGLTTEAGYWITENFEPVFRYEFYRPNAAFGPAATAETIGVSYFMRDYNTKIQLAGSAMQNMAAPDGVMTPTKGSHNTLVTMVLQASI